MSELGKLGIKVGRSRDTSSTSVQGLELNSTEITTLTLTLPRAAAIKASFAPEGMGKKLIKLFKKELQTGDPIFDDEIYISTDTPDETRKFLDDEVRNAIGVCVTTGGPIEIDGTTVTIRLPGDEQGEPNDVLVIARALLS